MQKDQQHQPKNKNKGYIALIIIAVAAIVGLVSLLFLGQRPETTSTDDQMIHYLKPLIYLYPEEDTEVAVKLGRPELLTTVYPKYEDGWKVLAKPDGDLTDLSTGRQYYGLYWEGQNAESRDMRDEGFVVAKEDTVEFLEEKLAILGLNEREADEFIIYWLPKLESSEYNYVYFETMEEINENMPLSVSPVPDTVIRVLMEFKGLDKSVEISEQTLAARTRSGFTVVEWGGTELK